MCGLLVYGVIALRLFVNIFGGFIQASAGGGGGGVYQFKTNTFD